MILNWFFILKNYVKNLAKNLRLNAKTQEGKVFFRWHSCKALQLKTLKLISEATSKVSQNQITWYVKRSKASSSSKSMRLFQPFKTCKTNKETLEQNQKNTCQFEYHRKRWCLYQFVLSLYSTLTQNRPIYLKHSRTISRRLSYTKNSLKLRSKLTTIKNFLVLTFYLSFICMKLYNSLFYECNSRMLSFYILFRWWCCHSSLL